MEIQYATKFRKDYRKADRKIQAAFDTRRRLFEQNQFHALLNNHKLTGRYQGFRSINVTGDWRALYIHIGSVVSFETLGTHSQLYR